jgi:hypothetical protein
VGLEALFGGAGHTLGNTGLGLSTVVASYAPLVLDFGALRARTGVALGAGVTWANSSAIPAANQQNALRGYAELRVTQTFELELSGRLSALAGLELGRAAGLRAYADTTPVGATGGWFGGIGAGLRY